MLLIINIHWNFCWSYDLYLSVKKPMSYTEHFYYFYRKITYTFGILFGFMSFFISSLLDSDEKSTICLMNRGMTYAIFITVPLILSIVINLYINLKYGRDAYLKKFSKNYTEFKLIFRVQRMYFITWTITMIPCILFSLVSQDLFMPIYTSTLALQPMCIILTVSLSRKVNKRLKHEEMRKAGLVQKMMQATKSKDQIGNLKLFIILEEFIFKYSKILGKSNFLSYI